jgi:hypothetical protein
MHIMPAEPPNVTSGVLIDSVGFGDVAIQFLGSNAYLRVTSTGEVEQAITDAKPEDGEIKVAVQQLRAGGELIQAEGLQRWAAA